MNTTYAVQSAAKERIAQALGSKIIKTGEYHGDFFLVVPGLNVMEVVEFLRKDPSCLCDHFIDLCGVDYYGQQPRFESVIHLYSTVHKHRIRVRCQVPDDTLTVPSITGFWKAANWQERESYDQYGIVYEGHPNLTRILSAPGVTYHAQRKDFALKGDREKNEDL